MASMDMAAKPMYMEAPRTALLVAQVWPDAPRAAMLDAQVEDTEGAQVCGDCGLTTSSVEAQDLVGEGTLRKGIRSTGTVTSHRRRHSRLSQTDHVRGDGIVVNLDGDAVLADSSIRYYAEQLGVGVNEDEGTVPSGEPEAEDAGGGLREGSPPRHLQSKEMVRLSSVLPKIPFVKYSVDLGSLASDLFELRCVLLKLPSEAYVDCCKFAVWRESPER